MTNIEHLKKLYMEISKHFRYQSLPLNLKEILQQEQLVALPGHDEARLEYICSQLDFSDKKVLDIGGNLDFFTFEALRVGAGHVDYYEGNKIYAEFVSTSSKVLECEEKVTVYPEYYLFTQSEKQYDIVFCLNVIHHLGGSFDSETNIEYAKEKMLSCINKLASITDTMVFQMGFNWCGNKEHCLFENGTKTEMENFLREGTAEFWDITKCGIAENNNDVIAYHDMNEKNNIRIDNLGEFLNRPIFIMKSKIHER